MTTQDSKYNSLINTLRKSKPVSENAELIIENIMLSVQENRRIKPNKIIVWMRPLLTSAALVLLGLLFYQTNNVETIRNSDNQFKSVNFTFVKKEPCGSFSTGKFQRSTNLMSQYKCYMRSNHLENEVSKKIYSKYLAKIQKSEAQ